MMREQHAVDGKGKNKPQLPTIRKKRRSKYDIPNTYESSSHSLFVSYPGQSQCHSPSPLLSSSNKNNTVNDKDNINKPLTEDPSLNLRPVKDRTIFTDEQMIILERAYQRDKNARPEIRQYVADLTGLSAERVRIWYQNRKAKERRDHEDEWADLTKVIQSERMQGTLQPSSSNPKVSLLQKINQVDQLFTSPLPSLPLSLSSTAYSTKPKSRSYNHHRDEKHHQKSKNTLSSSSRKEKEMVKKLLRAGSSSSTIIHTSTKRTTTKMKRIKSIEFDSQEEYNTVKNLLREPKLKEKPSQPLPGIQTFSSSRHKKESSRDEYRQRARHSLPVPSSKSSRKRHFRDKEDIDEAKFIQKLLKDSNIDSSSSKKQKILPNVVVKQENMTEHEEQLMPSALQNRTAFIDINSTAPSPQQQPQQQSQLVNQSLMQTINSDEWNNPFAFLPKGMNDFVNFFTPEQLQILQLLNQRHILESYQSMAEAVGNVPSLNMQQGNIIEEHGPRSQFYTNVESISKNAHCPSNN